MPDHTRPAPALLLALAGVLAAVPASLAQPSAADPAADPRLTPWLQYHHAHAGPGGCEEAGCGRATALRAAALSRAVETTIPPFATDRPFAWTGQEDGLGRNPYQSREAFTATDLLTVDLDIEIIPATEVIQGSNTMRVRSLQDGLTQFTFMLRNNYTISRIAIDGTDIPTAQIPVAPAGSYARVVPLPRAYANNEEFTIQVWYSGVALSRGFGSIEFGTQAGVPIVSALSQPYWAATWWPVKDGDVFTAGDNKDKSIGRISVTADSSLKTVSNGLLEAVEPLPGNRTRYRWRTNYPTASYLYTFSTTNYVQWSRTYTYPLPAGGTATMPVQFSIYPSFDSPTNRAAWEVVLPMLEAFRPIFGEYPFVQEKYGIYQFPFGGGMEHQTYSGQGTFDEGVTAHELAHQWWGDWVNARYLQDLWLQEGFATYSEALWFERKPGSTGLPALRSAMIARRPSATNIGQTVIIPTSQLNDMNRIFNSTTYRKGGWVLHMLRGVVGDQNFFNTLLTYRDLFAGSAATTAEFESIAQSISGQDLTGFFSAWLRGVGAPSYEAGFENVVVHGQRYARVLLRQTHATTSGAGGVFPMPVRVRFATGAGNVNASLNSTARQQWFLVPLPAAATSLTIDPDDWILTDTKASTTYALGPAKVVGLTPALLSPLPAGTSVPSIEVRFSDAVTVATSQATLTGPSGTVALTLSQPADRLSLTLTPGAALTEGTYTLTLTGATGLTGTGPALDGEVLAGTLPSGNGLAGGAAVISFTIPSLCDSVDFNNDGVFPDDADIADFVLVLGGGPCPTCNDVDFNNDGVFPDDADLLAFLNRLGGGACP